ncbi:MAG TPA: hypothetical protein ENI15_19410 [Spirochaetes bacterium]|nr:hypothetical protein [Spirochaetota bacterium]
MNQYNYSIYYISWDDAVRFCNALSTLLGLEEVYDESTWEADFTKNGFYLPTEAQWEGRITTLGRSGIHSTHGIMLAVCIRRIWTALWR